MLPWSRISRSGAEKSTAAEDLAVFRRKGAAGGLLMMQCWLLQCRSFQQSRIEAAGVENKASASIISSSSSELFLLLF